MILAIETSCDETAVALFDSRQGLQGEWLRTQIDLHRAYGGVVPDLASREHGTYLPPLITEALRHGKPETLAVTIGPGLAACLAQGLAAAKALALARGLPLWGVNHLRAHAWSVFIGLHAEAPPAFEERLEQFLPHLGLLVSGGNTLLFQLDRQGGIEVLAGTVDDAAGEALDKGAKLLGMAYPGGPLIEQAAVGGDPARFEFPRAFAQEPEPRFSFSGLKTSLRYRLEAMADAELRRALPDLCASYQAAVVDSLVRQTRKALHARRYRSLGLSGGVANNRLLRTRLGDLAEAEGLPLFRAEPKHTGDNASMIAFAGYFDQPGVDRTSGLGLGFEPGLEIEG